MKGIKNLLKLSFRIALTIFLFLILFGGIGGRWHETEFDGLYSENPFKDIRFLEKVSKKEFVPLAFEEVCEIRQRGRVYIKIGAKRLLLNTSFHCSGKEFTFVRIEDERGRGFRKEVTSLAKGEKVFIKSQGIKIAPVSLKELFQEISNLDMSSFIPWIIFAIAMKTMGVFSSLGRWAILLGGQGVRFPFIHLLGTFFVGRFFGMFLPSTIGLDGYRLYDSIRFSKRPIECTAVIAIEKVIGIISLTFIVFLTLPLGIRIVEIRNVALLFLILLALLLFVVFFLFLLLYPSFVMTLLRLAPIPFKSRFMGFLGKIVDSATAYHDKKKVLFYAILLGFFVHLGTILMYVGTMMSLKAEGISTLDILFAAPLMIYGTVIGPTIGGEGIREGVFVFLIGAKTGGSKAFMIGHLGFWIAEFLLSIPGIFFYFLRPQDYKPVVTMDDLKEIKERTTHR